MVQRACLPGTASILCPIFALLLYVFYRYVSMHQIGFLKDALIELC